MKIIPQLYCCLALLLSTYAHAGLISNGDFQNCNFTHWQKDTDGLGDPGTTDDFSIDNNAGECSAEISVNAINGATAFEANTLFTSLDLTNATGNLQLSFDWSFSGSDLSDNASDLFVVSINDGAGNLFAADGSHGHLIAPTFDYDAGTFTTLINNSFNNHSAWFLDFTVQTGFNLESASSKLIIDNVSLTGVVTNVPEPSSLAILCLAIFGLFAQQRRENIKGAF